MKLASWVLPATSSLALCAGVSSTFGAEQEGAVRVTSAYFAVGAPGRFERELSETLEAPSDLTWTRVDLPHARRRVLSMMPVGDAVLVEDFVTAWYRVELPPTTDSRSQALYFPRWAPGAGSP